MLDIVERAQIIKSLLAERPQLAVYSDAGTLSIQEAGQRLKFMVVIVSCMFSRAFAFEQVPPAWTATARSLAESATVRAARHVPNHFVCVKTASKTTQYVCVRTSGKTDLLRFGRLTLSQTRRNVLCVVRCARVCVLCVKRLFFSEHTVCNPLPSLTCAVFSIKKKSSFRMILRRKRPKKAQAAFFVFLELQIQPLFKTEGRGKVVERAAWVSLMSAHWNSLEDDDPRKLAASRAHEEKINKAKQAKLEYYAALKAARAEEIQTTEFVTSGRLPRSPWLPQTPSAFAIWLSEFAAWPSGLRLDERVTTAVQAWSTAPIATREFCRMQAAHLKRDRLCPFF